MKKCVEILITQFKNRQTSGWAETGIPTCFFGNLVIEMSYIVEGKIVQIFFWGWQKVFFCPLLYMVFLFQKFVGTTIAWIKKPSKCRCAETGVFVRFFGNLIAGIGLLSIYKIAG